MKRSKTNRFASVKGRGTPDILPNRFEPVHLDFDASDPAHETAPQEKTRFLVDHSKTVLAKNHSPDVPFDYSINPYRGCEHGCVYCYARPTHEYFGLSAGLDFETRIFVKRDAPELLARELQRSSWRPQVVAFSGNTDCYQPVEKKLLLTRNCLQVFLQFRNPVGLITKNALVLRDLDVLTEMRRMNLVRVTLSITTLNPRLARVLEPRTSSPRRRLLALQKLSRAGIPTCVNIAPVIPGLNDQEIPAILRAARACGVQSARLILLRLPFGVKDLFRNWLARHLPELQDKVMRAVAETRAGRLNDPCFGTRLTGVGKRAEMIRTLFELQCRRLGLDQPAEPLCTTHFRRNGRQRELF